jgi:hypothetical protein
MLTKASSFVNEVDYGRRSMAKLGKSGFRTASKTDVIDVEVYQCESMKYLLTPRWLVGKK